MKYFSLETRKKIGLKSCCNCKKNNKTIEEFLLLNQMSKQPELALETGGE